MAQPVEHRHYTPEEYFAIEERTEYPLEYLYGEVLPKVGITLDHNVINGNLGIALHRALEDTDYEVFMCRMRVEACPNFCYLYPDVVVIQCPVQLAENIQQDTLTKPLIIAEIFSEATERNDRGRKFEACRQIETFREYILVDQQRVHIESFVKTADGSWNMREYNEIESDLPIASLNLTIPMQAIYRRVEFPTEPKLTRIKEQGADYGHDNQ